MLKRLRIVMGKRARARKDLIRRKGESRKQGKKPICTSGDRYGKSSLSRGEESGVALVIDKEKKSTAKKTLPVHPLRRRKRPKITGKKSRAEKNVGGCVQQPLRQGGEPSRSRSKPEPGKKKKALRPKKRGRCGGPEGLGEFPGVGWAKKEKNGR